MKPKKRVSSNNKPVKYVTLDQHLISRFGTAVSDYHDEIIRSFHSEHGAPDNMDILKKKVIMLFGFLPSASRNDLLKKARKKLARPFEPCRTSDSSLFEEENTARLNEWLKDLAKELVKGLKK